MAVTSQIKAESFGEVVVSKWSEAGLLKPSAVKPVISTIEKDLVLKRLGRLENEDLSEVNATILKILGQ